MHLGRRCVLCCTYSLSVVLELRLGLQPVRRMRPCVEKRAHRVGKQVRDPVPRVSQSGLGRVILLSGSGAKIIRFAGVIPLEVGHGGTHEAEKNL
jgi:hypothetical protein